MSKQQRDDLGAMLRGGPLDLGGDVHQQRAVFAEMMNHFPPADDVVLTDSMLGDVPVVTVTAGTETRRGHSSISTGGPTPSAPPAFPPG